MNYSLRLDFHSKIVKTSDDRTHRSTSVTVTTHVGGKIVLSEAMARGLMALPTTVSTAVPIGAVNVAVYTAHSLYTRYLVGFETERMSISLTAFGLDVANALRASGVFPSQSKIGRAHV